MTDMDSNTYSTLQEAAISEGVDPITNIGVPVRAAYVWDNDYLWYGGQEILILYMPSNREQAYRIIMQSNTKMVYAAMSLNNFGVWIKIW